MMNGNKKMGIGKYNDNTKCTSTYQMAIRKFQFYGMDFRQAGSKHV